MPASTQLRKAQWRNILATLFLSQGVPWLRPATNSRGRQRGRQQRPTARHNEISWVDWHLHRRSSGFGWRFVGEIARSLTGGMSSFAGRASSRAAASARSVKDVTWLNVGRTEMKQSEWAGCEPARLGDLVREVGTNFQGRLLLLMNAGDSKQHFVLPSGPVGEALESGNSNTGAGHPLIRRPRGTRATKSLDAQQASLYWSADMVDTHVIERWPAAGHRRRLP